MEQIRQTLKYAQAGQGLHKFTGSHYNEPSIISYHVHKWHSCKTDISMSETFRSVEPKTLKFKGSWLQSMHQKHSSAHIAWRTRNLYASAAISIKTSADERCKGAYPIWLHWRGQASARSRLRVSTFKIWLQSEHNDVKLNQLYWEDCPKPDHALDMASDLTTENFCQCDLRSILMINLLLRGLSLNQSCGIIFGRTIWMNRVLPKNVPCWAQHPSSDHLLIYPVCIESPELRSQACVQQL